MRFVSLSLLVLACVAVPAAAQTAPQVTPWRLFPWRHYDQQQIQFIQARITAIERAIQTQGTQPAWQAELASLRNELALAQAAAAPAPPAEETGREPLLERIHERLAEIREGSGFLAALGPASPALIALAIVVWLVRRDKADDGQINFSPVTNTVDRLKDDMGNLKGLVQRLHDRVVDRLGAGGSVDPKE